MLTSPPAFAQTNKEGTEQIPPSPLLDGQRISFGPAFSTRHDERWLRSWGAIGAWTTIREQRTIPVIGVVGRFTRVSSAQEWELHFSGIAAELFRGVPVGVGAGVSARFGETFHSRWGAHGELWLFAGLSISTQITVVQEEGWGFHFNIALPFPVWGW